MLSLLSSLRVCALGGYTKPIAYVTKVWKCNASQGRTYAELCEYAKQSYEMKILALGNNKT